MVKNAVILLLSLPLGFIVYVVTNITLADLIKISGLGKYSQLTTPNQVTSDVHLLASFIIVFIILKKILSRYKSKTFY